MAEPVSSFMDEHKPEPSVPPSAASIAREVNVVIREMAERLDAVAIDKRPVGFLCECGCLAIVPATVAEYDAASGAWFEGHEPS